MKKFYDVKYIPTGNVFTFGKEEADRLVAEEPENFKVLDDDYEMPIVEEKQEVTYDKIVDDSPEEEKAVVKETKTTKAKKKK